MNWIVPKTGPTERINAIADRFSGMISDLESAVDECAAEKMVSRERSKEAERRYQEIEKREIDKQIVVQQSIEKAESLSERLAGLLVGGKPQEPADE